MSSLKKLLEELKQVTVFTEPTSVELILSNIENHPDCDDVLFKRIKDNVTYNHGYIFCGADFASLNLGV